MPMRGSEAKRTETRIVDFFKAENKDILEKHKGLYFPARKSSHVTGNSHNQLVIDEFQINEINVDLRTSGFDNEVLSVDACAVWWERESFYCLPRIGVVTWHREPRFQCGSARTGSIWNSSIFPFVMMEVSAKIQCFFSTDICTKYNVSWLHWPATQ